MTEALKAELRSAIRTYLAVLGALAVVGVVAEQAFAMNPVLSGADFVILVAAVFGAAILAFYALTSLASTRLGRREERREAAALEEHRGNRR